MKLIPHPSSPPSPITAIEARIGRSAQGGLELSFLVEGDLERVLLPTSDNPGRREGLWKHCCFEAFIAPEGREAYAEINLSPAGDWAVWLFSGYRRDMIVAQVPAPAIDCWSNRSWLSLSARLDLGGNDALDPGREARIGLCAVIEAKDGSLSYWALAHPPGRPDFHHRDCFVARLAPAGQS